MASLNRLLDEDFLDFEKFKRISQFLVFKKRDGLIRLEEKMTALRIEQKAPTNKVIDYDLSVDKYVNQSLKKVFIFLIVLKTESIDGAENMELLLQEFLGPYGSYKDKDKFLKIKKGNNAFLKNIEVKKEELTQVNINSLYDICENLIRN